HCRAECLAVSPEPSIARRSSVCCGVGKKLGICMEGLFSRFLIGDPAVQAPRCASRDHPCSRSESSFLTMPQERCTRDREVVGHMRPVYDRRVFAVHAAMKNDVLRGQFANPRMPRADDEINEAAELQS